MTGSLDGRVIRGVDANATSFRNSFKALRNEAIKTEVCAVLRAMLFQPIDTAPRAWHMHQLAGRQVPSRLDASRRVPAWSLHVTADDRYKASFTFEDGVVYLRLVDEHDVVDKRP